MTLQDYFEELAAIDNVHPNEAEVLDYVMAQLDGCGVQYDQDEYGNIVGNLKSEKSGAGTVAVCGHVDIAAPLNGRKLVREGNILKTDGTALLGGDDKTAVAAMLALAEEVSAGKMELGMDVQLIFTRGEEAGLQGARNLDYGLFTADDVMVFDWSGTVSETVTRSPAYVTVDVTFTGKQAHPAEWELGVNAGKFLMDAASQLQQGEYAPGVNFNIGQVMIGQARNQVPGEGRFLAELRSFDGNAARAAAKDIETKLLQYGTENDILVTVHIDSETGAFEYDKDSAFAKKVTAAIEEVGLTPRFTETYGCFDGNIFATKGKNVVILGAGYYHPHGPDEYVNLDEFEEMYAFIRTFVSA